ncbi:MAG TPA: class I SAM-dependent methyltransferase [Polyangiaceae bacterium]|nr:class I SAM-dependent methyltransferase [Polyangiaceae bacterium]
MSVAPPAYWVGFTTLYREGGGRFSRAARTLGAELRAKHPRARVVVESVESKADLVRAMASLRAEGLALAELHFIGHSGMYGPMFRTTKVPEQLSPHEWRALAAEGALPFAPGGEAYFHCCRSARWFAPFFARTFGVPARGHHLYTTFSRARDRFAWDGGCCGMAGADAPLHVVALPGRKSHGLGATALKYAGALRPEAMLRFLPDPTFDPAAASYDRVADLYDEAFADIGVRGPEVAWLERHLPDASTGARALEIGCGNGALLARLAPRLGSGLGLDASSEMIARARRRFGHTSGLRFDAVTGPALPADDASVDVVISMLSFRYLDWDPIMAEIRRVLAPGGRLLIVDMVAVPAGARDAPRLVAGALARARSRVHYAHFHRKLGALVRDPSWAEMLKYNPIRSEHEVRWYLEGRFPGRRVEVLTVALASRVVAFDSGPLPRGFALPQSYP